MFELQCFAASASAFIFNICSLLVFRTAKRPYYYHFHLLCCSIESPTSSCPRFTGSATTSVSYLFLSSVLSAHWTAIGSHWILVLSTYSILGPVSSSRLFFASISYSKGVPYSLPTFIFYVAPLNHQLPSLNSSMPRNWMVSHLFLSLFSSLTVPL